MMKKIVLIDRNAERELKRFSYEVRTEFDAHFDILRDKGMLEFPEARKVTKKLFEIRIKFKGEFRGFYAYLRETNIILLHVFRKKTAKTPLKNLKVAERRLKLHE